MKFSHKAYLKPLAHAAKYPTGPVNGVFLAETNSTNVVDAVPFFHFWGTLTPMLEVAMTQVLIQPEERTKGVVFFPSIRKERRTRVQVSSGSRNTDRQTERPFVQDRRNYRQG